MGDITASPLLCTLCFDTLHERLFPNSTPGGGQTSGWFKSRTASESASSSSSSALAVSTTLQPLLEKNADLCVGIFVTWSKKDRARGWKLRGCIGSLSPIRLEPGLRNYAITAACEDSRFPPIAKEEFISLKCGVSLLVNFEKDLKWDQWEVGIHGVLIKFRATQQQLGGSTTFRATYLPEVAPSQGWSKIETIRSLCEKAGYSGAVDQALLDSISLERYTSIKTEMTYDEWVHIKRQQQQQQQRDHDVEPDNNVVITVNQNSVGATVPPPST